jgi:hypothetical protein
MTNSVASRQLISVASQRLISVASQRLISSRECQYCWDIDLPAEIWRNIILVGNSKISIHLVPSDFPYFCLKSLNKGLCNLLLVSKLLRYILENSIIIFQHEYYNYDFYTRLSYKVITYCKSKCNYIIKSSKLKLVLMTQLFYHIEQGNQTLDNYWKDKPNPIKIQTDTTRRIYSCSYHPNTEAYFQSIVIEYLNKPTNHYITHLWECDKNGVLIYGLGYEYEYTMQELQYIKEDLKILS